MIIATHVVSDIEYIARDIIMLKKGVIIDNAPPHELVTKIEGKVWSVPAAENDVADIQQKFRVTSIARDEDIPQTVLLRVSLKSKPTEVYSHCSPDTWRLLSLLVGEVIKEIESKLNIFKVTAACRYRFCVFKNCSLLWTTVKKRRMMIFRKKTSIATGQIVHAFR